MQIIVDPISVQPVQPGRPWTHQAQPTIRHSLPARPQFDQSQAAARQLTVYDMPSHANDNLTM